MTGGIFFPLRMIRDLLDNEPFQLPITLLHGENDGVERALLHILSAPGTFADLPFKAAGRDEGLWSSIAGRAQFASTANFKGYLAMPRILQ